MASSGTPRQQFQHMGVIICYICADERVDELRIEGKLGLDGWVNATTLARRSPLHGILVEQEPVKGKRHAHEVI